MTGFDISTVVPTKFKPFVGLVGSLLTFIIPTVVSVSTGLPQPWPWLIAAVVGGLTWLGIYKAPYVPKDAVLVPKSAAPPTHTPWD